MYLFLHTIRFSQDFISYVKEPSHFSMLEAKLWHNKTETKNVKVVKMVACSFNFGNIFNSIILSSTFCLRKNRSLENTFGEECVISFCLGVMIKTWVRVLLGGVSRNGQIVFANNLNTIALKLFCNHGGISMFRKKKIKKYSKPLMSR